MAKTKAKAKEEQREDPTRFRIGGAWRHEDKKGNAYLVTPLNPETITHLIKVLEESQENGCKIISFINGFREKEEHPHFIHYVYPKTEEE